MPTATKHTGTSKCLARRRQAFVWEAAKAAQDGSRPAAGSCTSTGPEAVRRIPPVARLRRYKKTQAIHENDDNVAVVAMASWSSAIRRPSAHDKACVRLKRLRTDGVIPDGEAAEAAGTKRI